MPMYDRKCDKCETIELDCYEPVTFENPTCECGGVLVRTWLTTGPGVIQDSIEGGVMIRHGLCWPDGSPRRFDSHTEIKREAKKKGLTNHVEHKTAPGTDKNKHTTKWI